MVRRYSLRGPTYAALAGRLPGITGVSPVAPPSSLDITLDDATANPIDVDADLEEQGWIFSELNPPATTTLGIAQARTARLEGAQSVGSNFEDILTVSLSTKGGTTCVIVASAVAQAISLGADLRVELNGGSFSNAVYGDTSFPVLTGGFAGFTTSEQIPVTSSRTTYTVKLRARRAGLGALTLAPRITSLLVVEYA